MSIERKPKDKRRSATAKELEAIIEQLMVEVAASFPSGRYQQHPDSLKPWAHMTAMYVMEVLKRKDSPRETIIKKARRAVRRRIERDLADSYLGMVLPTGREESIRSASTEEEAPDDGD